MKKMQLLFFPVLLLILSGCYDAKEPNNIAYVVAIGVDLSEDCGIYDYTIQFAKTTQISGGSSEEGGKEGSEIVEVINVKAPTVYSAVNIANQSVSKNFTLAHTKLIVISHEIAERGVRDLFDTFGRNSDIRPNIYIAVSSGSAKDYLDSVKPIAEINPISYYRQIFESERGGYIPRVLLKDFYFQIDDENKQNVLPLAGVNEKNRGKNEDEGHKTEENEDEGHKMEAPKSKINYRGFDFMTKTYYAGESEVEKKNPSEVIGMAVFDGEKMIGVMDNIDSFIYNILQGSFKLSYISFYSEKTPEVPVTVGVIQQRKPKIAVKTKGERPLIKINVYMEGQLISESTDNPVEKDIKKTEKQIENEVESAVGSFLEKTQNEFGVDIIGFGQYAKADFLTNDEYEKYDWRSHYPKAEFDISVHFSMKNTGFIDLKDIERGKNK